MRRHSGRAGRVFEAIGPCVAGLVLILMTFLFIVVPAYPALFCRQVVQVPLAGDVGHDGDGALWKRYWIVADPQIEGEKPGFGKYLNNIMNDNYYEFITWAMAAWKGPFDGIVFLGDVFSFQYHRNEQFEKIDARFRDSFAIAHDGPISWKDGVHAAIAGNHDLGYAAELPEWGVARWERTYGPRLWSHDIAPGVTVVAVDALELDGHLRSQATWNFLKRHSKAATDHQIVLMTHIPLHKPAGTCRGDNPQFEYYQGDSGWITQQNTLSEETTRWILENMNVILAFSGHDHEGCFHRHTVGARTVPDLTVRAVQGDYAGNTAVMDVTSKGLYIEECTAFTTKATVGSLVVLQVAVVAMVVYSCVVMRSSRKERSKVD